MHLTPEKLIALLIITPENSDITSRNHLPHLCISQLAEKTKRLYQTGIRTSKLYVYVPKKTKDGSSGLDHNNLMIQALRTAKEAEPRMRLMTEVCACAYSSNGECVILDKEKKLNHQATLDYTAQMSVLHAQAGCDIACAGLTHNHVIQSMRQSLDAQNFQNVSITASIQYKSSFYAPYRHMMLTEPQDGETHRCHIRPDDFERTTQLVKAYQKQGATSFIIQPALPNIDNLQRIRQLTKHPLFAYSVSSELPLICDKQHQLIENKQEVALEYYQSLLRAGATHIMTYLSEEIAATL